MRFHLIAPLAVCATAFVLSTDVANADVPVATIAHTHGLTLARLDPETAIELAGQAMRIVLRPGDQVAEINGRLETLSSAPYLRKGEMYVSDADSRRLDKVAGAPSVAVSGPVAQAPNASARPGGAITLDVKPVVGSDALAISGTAPAGRAVQVTLYATYSRDIPDVLLSRQTLLPSPAGAFSATLPIAPGFFRGAVITVVATTPPSGPSASARYTVAAPNVTVPPDNLPHDIK